MLPKIKKKIKSFMMDETGTISKSNLIKGALLLSATSVSLKKVSAQAAVAPTMSDVCESDIHPSGAAVGGTCGGETENLPSAIGGEQWCCALSSSGTTDQSKYFCEEDKFTCTTGAGGGSACTSTLIPVSGSASADPYIGTACAYGSVDSDGTTHKNCGTATVVASNQKGHTHSLSLYNEGSTTAGGVTGSHSHHGSHGNYIGTCASENSDPLHTSHCSHGSHGSHGSHSSWGGW